MVLLRRVTRNGESTFLIGFEVTGRMPVPLWLWLREGFGSQGGCRATLLVPAGWIEVTGRMPVPLWLWLRESLRSQAGCLCPFGCG